MDLNLINANVNNLLTNVASVIDYTSGKEYERVIQLPDNGPTTTWSKVGELKGVSTGEGADLAFTVRGVNDKGHLGRQALKVMATQRGTGLISVKAYSLGESHSLTVTVGYVQLNDFDFDIYLKRDQYNPCSVVGQNSNLNGTLDNFGEVTTEPTGIVYVPTHTVLNSDMDTGWLPLTLVNGWVVYPDAIWAGPNGVPSYRKLPDGTVEVRAVIAYGTFANDVTLTQLPVGFRPINSTMSFAYAHDRIACSLDILSDGNIKLRFPSGNVVGDNDWLSLNLSFSTE